MLRPGGVVAVTTFGTNPAIARLARTPAAHAPSAEELRKLFTDAGFDVIDQHRVARPAWIQRVADELTVGRKM